MRQHIIKDGKVVREVSETPWLILFYFILSFFRAAPTAYVVSQVRGQIRAVADGLHHSHSNEGSEPHLQPTPQLTATPDP